MYIPVSNIVEVNYTDGFKFVVESTQQNYIGYYHKDKSRNYWSGQTHTDSSVKLIDISDNGDTLLKDNVTKLNYLNIGYNKLNPKVLPNTSIQPDFIYPTAQDYINGFFIRYVVKPTINIQITDFIEITNSKYLTIIQSNDLLVLYKPTSFLWKLTGPLYDVYKDNIRMVSGIIDTNKRSIQEAEKFIPNLSLYLIDPLQFAKISSSDKPYYPALGGMYKDKGPRGSRY
jgi:hypothetical protein